MEHLKRLSEFKFTSRLIAEITEWIHTQTLPAHVDTPERAEAWQHNFANVEDRDGHLFFQDHEVLLWDDRTGIRDAIQAAYDSPQGLGKGINQLSIYLHDRFIGIRRADVARFLKGQPDYQWPRRTRASSRVRCR